MRSSILEIGVKRLSVASRRPFADVVSAFEDAIGHPDMGKLWKDIASARDFGEIERIIHDAIGRSGLMLFARMDHGQFLKMVQTANAPRILRFIVGNPLIMMQMAKHVPDAGSYAPVTVLIDERSDGVHLSYDTMASYLAGYGKPAAIKVACDLDAKVEALITTAAG